jgi:hypothetical protein
MYINKTMALMQSQMVQLQAAIHGFQTTCSTGSDGASPIIETTIFYETEEEGEMLERLIHDLWHDGDTIKKGDVKYAHWIEYQVRFK